MVVNKISLSKCTNRRILLKYSSKQYNYPCSQTGIVREVTDTDILFKVNFDKTVPKLRIDLKRIKGFEVI